MDSSTLGTSIYREIDHAIDHAVDILEDELKELNLKSATDHEHVTKTYTPMNGERRAKLRKNMSGKGLSLEKAIVKALDEVFEYWKQTSEAGKMPGRNDITKEARQKVIKVKATMLAQLKTDDPELSRDDAQAATYKKGEAADQLIREIEAKIFPARGRQHGTRAQRGRGRRRGNDQNRKTAPTTPSRRSRTEINHHHQNEREPVQSPIATPQIDHEDKWEDSITVRTDPSPASDAPRSSLFRSNTGNRHGPARRAQSAHLATPTREGGRRDAGAQELPRRNPPRGTNRTRLEAAAANPNPSTHRAAAAAAAQAKREPAKAADPPSAPPRQQHRGTTRMLDQLDQRTQDLALRLGQLEDGMREQERVARDMERELNDVQRRAAQFRRALSELNDIGPVVVIE